MERPEKLKGLCDMLRGMVSKWTTIPETEEKAREMMPLTDEDEEYPPLVANPANRAAAEGLLKHLKATISEGMTLPEIMSAFEAMCRLPALSPEEDILFEMGTFEFTGKKLFYVSFVRQFSNGAEEFFRLHVDVRSIWTRHNFRFPGLHWAGRDFSILTNMPCIFMVGM